MRSKFLALALITVFSQAADASETKNDYERFLLAADSQKFPQALLLINRLLKKNPADQYFLAERARVLMNVNRLAEAKADCTKALKTNKSDFSALRTRSYCYLMERDYKNGIADLKQVLSLSQPTPFHMFPTGDHGNLAKAYALIGRPQEAAK